MLIKFKKNMGRHDYHARVARDIIEQLCSKTEGYRRGKEVAIDRHSGKEVLLGVVSSFGFDIHHETVCSYR